MCRYILADVAGDNDLEKQLDEGQIYSMRTFLSAMYALLQLTVGNNWCVRVGTHCVVPRCIIGEADRQDAVSCRNSIVYPNVDSTNRVYSLFFCVYVLSGSGVSVTF